MSATHTMDSDNVVIPQLAEVVYPTAQNAIDALFAHGKEYRYCIRLRRSKPDGKDVVKTKHYYVCDRHGEYTPRGFGVRSTASIATMISYSGLGRGSALEIAAIQVGDISRNGGSAGRGIRERGRPSLAVRSKQLLIASV